jgi:hypothetical protein
MGGDKPVLAPCLTLSMLTRSAIMVGYFSKPKGIVQSQPAPVCESASEFAQILHCPVTLCVA